MTRMDFSIKRFFMRTMPYKTKERKYFLFSVYGEFKGIKCNSLVELLKNKNTKGAKSFTYHMLLVVH